MREKRIKGSFTVEAAILLPFILVMTCVGIYFVIFVYDRTLMVQDAENISSLLLLGEKIYKDPITDHPYLAITNMTVVTEEKENEMRVTISGEWTLPIMSGFDSKITYTQKRVNTKPSFVMHLTDDLKVAGGTVKKWAEKELNGN